MHREASIQHYIPRDTNIIIQIYTEKHQYKIIYQEVQR